LTEIESRVQDAALIDMRRDQIADSALRAFSERGFHRTTIRDVAKAGSISVGLVYDYIGQKEDLLELIYAKAMREGMVVMRASVAGVSNPAEALTGLIRANLEVVDQHHECFLLMYRESASMTPRALSHVLKEENEYVGLYRNCLRKGISSGVFREVDVQLHAVLLAFMCSVDTLKRWNLPDVTIDQLHTEISNYAMRGLAPDDE
jgi:AcrR family transcriptional regulator